jgi:hypothetical protein
MTMLSRPASSTALLTCSLSCAKNAQVEIAISAPRLRKSQMSGRIANGHPVGNFVRPWRNASDLA